MKTRFVVCLGAERKDKDFVFNMQLKIVEKGSSDDVVACVANSHVYVFELILC